jgi:DNA-binding response OmpR family regulator
LDVLVIEDDPKIGDTLVEAFEREGARVSLARNGEDGYFRASTERFDIILLDVTLPGRSGLEVLAALRKTDKETPVLILSSRGEVEDRVKGLVGGADDYLVKPFALSELMARVQVILRRGRTDRVLRLAVKDLRMDLVTRKVVRGAHPVDLTVREFELLEYLMRHAGETVGRDMLARDVWNEVNRVTPLDNVIDVHIARLRRKIDLPGQVKLIHTVRGRGFCLSEREPVD